MLRTTDTPAIRAGVRVSPRAKNAGARAFASTNAGRPDA